MIPHWIVSQIGSREHYAPARAFQSAACLDLLITDFWWARGASIGKRGPATVRALAARSHGDIPADKVASFNLATICDRARAAVRRGGGDAARQSLAYLDAGQRFALATRRVLSRRSLDPGRHAFFAYTTGALEAVEMLAERGIITVVDQIDPARTHVETVRAEQEKWPGWEKRAGDVVEDYWRRLEAEWHAASAVVVNSPWSRSALIRQGVPTEKIVTVPLAYEARVARARAVNTCGPLAVLSLGNVNLGKGIQYLIEAARLLEGENVEFTVAGPIGITADAIASAPRNVTFIGRVMRDRLATVYGSADVFAFPTLSDGFGITQIEAMAHGVPVIATPRCGEVVTDGRDGFVVPPADGRALAEAILKLERDRALLAEMSRQALRRAGAFSLSNYLTQLHGGLRRAGLDVDAPAMCGDR
jgi:glycosyltransferase involved in cell wall biosynthesis